MKTIQVTERVGEWFPFDHDFDPHARGTGWEQHPDRYTKGFEILRFASRNPTDWNFHSETGAIFPVLFIGMYDGWPYWRKMPAVQFMGPLQTAEVRFYGNFGFSDRLIRKMGRER